MNPVDPWTEEDLEHLAQNGMLEESHTMDQFDKVHTAISIH